MTNKEQAITNLQRYLREVSYDTLGGNKVPIDGIFDTATKDALADFQRRMGLAPTGVADKETWDALFAEYRKATKNKREAEPLYFFPDTPIDYALSLGERWMLVNIVQLLLMELRATYDIFEDIVESGVYDPATEQAIREFQRINGLSETGKVDEATYNRIVREYSNLNRGDNF